MEHLEFVDLARFQLGMLLGQKYGAYLTNAVTNETSVYNFPIITCENATESVPVIKFEKTNITDASIDNNCLKISGQDDISLIKLTDKIRYILLGVM